MWLMALNHPSRYPLRQILSNHSFMDIHFIKMPDCRRRHVKLSEVL
jgi:hypothetical protein